MLVQGKPGSPKELFPPLAKAVVATDTGRVTQIEVAPFCQLPGHHARTVLGEYPPKALAELDAKQSRARYRAYFEMCDKILAEGMEVGRIDQAVSYPDWKRVFTELAEPGYVDYFLQFIDVDNAISYQPTPATPLPIRTSESPKRSLPDQGTRPLHKNVGGDADPRHFLSELKPLVAEDGREQVRREWLRIQASLTERAFRVATVGEFSRGKSTVLNALIGEDMLPMSGVPTTSIPTRIKHAASGQRISHILPSGEVRNVGSIADLANSFAVDVNGADLVGVLDININNPWLAKTGVELLDTPGVGEDTGDRTEAAESAVRECDGAMVVVDATQPLSLTERTFIEEHLLSRRVPYVAVVVTHLDQINANERESVLNTISARLMKITSSAPLWVLNDLILPPGVTCVAVCGPTQIRAAIGEWSGDKELVRLRRSQALAAIRLLAGNLIDDITLRVKVAETEQQERLRLAEKATAELKYEEARWHTLRASMEERETASQAHLLEVLGVERKQQYAELKHQLTRAPDPAEWWTRDLSFVVRRALNSICARVSADSQRRFVKDATWLRDKVREQFKDVLKLSPPSWDMQINPDGETTTESELPDLKKMRQHTRLATAAAGIASLMIPVPGLNYVARMAMTAAAGIAGEKFVRNKTDMCRNELERRLSSFLSAIFDEVETRYVSVVNDAYGDVTDTLHKQANEWTSRTVSALSQEESVPVEGLKKMKSELVALNKIIES
jgi:GTPase SAR1 family protein